MGSKRSKPKPVMPSQNRFCIRVIQAPALYRWTEPSDITLRMNCCETTMGRKLWLLTGGATAIGIAISLLAILVPSFRDRSPLGFTLVRNMVDTEPSDSFNRGTAAA
jgi:hypothetical protein